MFHGDTDTFKDGLRDALADYPRPRAELFDLCAAAQVFVDAGDERSCACALTTLRREVAAYYRTVAAVRWNAYHAQPAAGAA